MLTKIITVNYSETSFYPLFRTDGESIIRHVLIMYKTWIYYSKFELKKYYVTEQDNIMNSQNFIGQSFCSIFYVSVKKIRWGVRVNILNDRVRKEIKDIKGANV